MGSFDDYMNSVDPDAMGEMIDALCKPVIVQSDFDRENLSAVLEFLYKKTLEDAAKISLVQLRSYHEWLQTQI